MTALALAAALASHAARADGPLRIPLGASPDWFATVGGEWRERFEWSGSPGFGAQPRDDDGQWLHRAHLDLAAHLGAHARLAVSLKSAFESGRAAGPRPVDVDRLDLHQAYADWLAPLGGASLALRLGRQELAYGSSRLVSVRASPNVRRSFDAARLRLERGAWRIDALLARPVEIDRGVFDDGGIGAQTLFGLYAVRALGALALDLYWLGLDDENASYDRGERPATRHSLGTRLSGTRGALDLDWEAVLQLGHFGDDSIVAWTFASETGWTFASLPLAPRIGIGADVASGDGGRGTLGTFDALFPRGSYFGEAAVIGPQNLVDVRPSVTLALRRDLSAQIDAAWFWRERRDDGVYSGNGVLIRAAEDGADARSIGSRIGARLEWTPRTWCTVALAYERYFAGRFLAQTGPAEDLDFVATWIEFAL